MKISQLITYLEQFQPDDEIDVYVDVLAKNAPKMQCYLEVR